MRTTKLSLLVWLGIICFVTLGYAAQPDTVWTHSYGGSSMDQFKHISKTSDGGFICAGTYTLRSAGADSLHYWLVRFDDQGDTLWAKLFAAGGNDGQFAYETTSGSFVLAGGGNPWLVLTDANGLQQSIVGSENAPSFEHGFMDYYAVPSGGFVMIGDINVGTDTDSYSAVINKYSDTGALEWTKQYDAPDGGVVPMQIIALDGGGYIVCGTAGMPNPAPRAGWVMKLDSNGDSLWTKKYPVDGLELHLKKLAAAADGGFIFGGLEEVRDTDPPERSIRLVKISADGTLEWSTDYNETGDSEEPVQVIEVADGYVVVANAVISMEDISIISYYVDGNGVQQNFEQRTSESGVLAVIDLISVDADNYLAIGIIDNGGEQLWDGWIAKFGPALGIIPPAINGIPRTFALHPAYPNPFNPSTTIGFSLPEAADVSLTVYDLSGRQVAELARGVMQPGNHTVAFHADQLATGVYFYQLQAGSFTQVRKMMLLK